MTELEAALPAQLVDLKRTRASTCVGLLVGLAFVLLSACNEESEGERELARFTFISELVTAAEAPAKLAVAPDGRLFYSEYITGNIRIISADGQLLKEPFAHVEVAEYVLDDGRQIWGLFGLTFDPEFDKNHYVYAYLMSPAAGGGQATVIRFTDIDNRGTDSTVILGDLPETNATPHVGGNVLFGPDGHLYVSLGDFSPGYSPDDRPHDVSFLEGKILRVDKADGSAPADNPFVGMLEADPRIFAYGFRNVFDFTFHPVTGRIYANDNGLFDCDELSVVDEGKDYGWPASHLVRLAPTFDKDAPCSNPDAVEPIYHYAAPGKKPQERTSNVGPTGVEFLSERGDLLLTCEVNTGFMRLLLLEGPDYDEVKGDRVIAEDCRLDIARAPDGTIYYSNFEEIRRLVPEPVSGP